MESHFYEFQVLRSCIKMLQLLLLFFLFWFSVLVKEKWSKCILMFLGTDRIFTRRKKRSREFEEGFSEKNKNVRVCIKTRTVCIFHFLMWLDSVFFTSLYALVKPFHILIYLICELEKKWEVELIYFRFFFLSLKIRRNLSFHICIFVTWIIFLL